MGRAIVNRVVEVVDFIKMNSMASSIESFIYLNCDFGQS